MRRSLAFAVVLATLVAAPAARAWAWPVDGPILRPFSLAADPYAGGQHRGVDIGAPPGAAVRAPASGTVSFVGSVPNGGRALTIQTADGYAVTLLQLGSVEIARGAAVEEGAAVGAVGESADPTTTAPHVHLGVRHASDSDGYVDPLGLLPARTDAVPASPLPLVPERASSGSPVPAPASPPAASAVSAPVEASPVQGTDVVGEHWPTGLGGCRRAAGRAPAGGAAHSGRARARRPARSGSDTRCRGGRLWATGVSGGESPSPQRSLGGTRQREARASAGPEPEPASTNLAGAAAADTGASHAASRRADAARKRGRDPGARHRPAEAAHERQLGPAPVATLASVVPAPVLGERREPLRRVAPVPPTKPDKRGRPPLVLLLGLALAAGAVALLGLRRRAPIISRDELLPDDTDLLRQLDAAHRPCLHHGRGGHPRAPSPPARRGDLLPDRGRRACGQGRAGRRRARALAPGVHRSHRRRVAGAAATAERVHRLLHPDER